MAATVEDKPSNWSRRRASMPAAKPPTMFAATSARVTRQALELASSQLLNGLHDGTMSETAYDTAIVSHLRSWQDPSRLAFPASIGWLRRHQRADGSWGGRIETAHDRIVSTLAAVVRLVELPDRWAQSAVHRGIAYLSQRAAGWQTDPHETVAFELLVPRLVDQARQLGLPLPFDALAPVTLLRDEKLRQIPDGFLYRTPTTLVHSLEYLGNALDAERVSALRGRNGAYGNSPSATAHVLSQVYDPQAEAYLRRVISVSLNGGASTVYPCELFERNWVLYNLGLAGIGRGNVRPHLEYLYRSLQPDGMGLSREGLIPDADDTAVALLLLRRAGYAVRLEPLLRFERQERFCSFPFERTTSTTVNAHVLEALRAWQPEAPDRYAPQVAKVVAYLRDQCRDGCYWWDKWHVSPYYATAHVVLAAQGIADELLARTGGWLLETQRPDGSWGQYEGTSEETAYALQALLTLRPAAPALESVLARGTAYLAERFDDTDYPELWIGKGLYTPYAIVRSAIISALRLYQLHRGARR